MCLSLNPALRKQCCQNTAQKSGVPDFSVAQVVFSQCAETPRVCQNIRTINPGETPLKLAQLSGTRWLSIYDCCVRFLGQWDELKLHFQLCKNAKRCYEAELLYQMYCDPINKLYLQFLMPILQEFSRVKKLFQLEIGYAFKMLDCLKTCFRSLVPKILTPNAIPPSDLRLIDVNLDDTRNHMPLSVVNCTPKVTTDRGI